MGTVAAASSLALYNPIRLRERRHARESFCFNNNNNNNNNKNSFKSKTLIRKRPFCIDTIGCSATTTKSTTIGFEVESKKHDLLRTVQDTQRGLVTTADQRSEIEEALVCVEGYDAGLAVDLGELDGTWRLQYTSAPDVLVLFESAARLPFFQVGQIFQKFECRDRTDGGIVRNVVRWSIPSLLEYHMLCGHHPQGAGRSNSTCFCKFFSFSKRNIFLQFEEVSIRNIKISEELQALIAPAILPRTYLSLQILQFLQTFSAQVPVNSPGRQSVGGLYYLSYLDRDMLLGRAVGGGGVFVFTKAQPLTL
ncbi:hypothetical protein Syun_020055 [Stephania yunnanensis]|uniref:Plastid lipid-associated protein/fibrillin conserved domain-containing protein n=1 Tax=Stephania yunnanensis TaxID=152371 RepID=A0AAP0NX83_9MAGN